MISLTSPIKTRAHGWPAWAKLLGLAVASVTLFRLEGIPAYGLVALGVLGLYALPGLEFFRSGLRCLRILVPFIVLVSIYHIVTDTYAIGIQLILRMIAAVGLANLVTMTTKLSEMMEVLHWLTTPLRWLGMNGKALEIVVALAIRFTPVLLDKINQLTESWRARSTKRPSWRIILPFVVMALDDADHVAEALKARGGVSE